MSSIKVEKNPDAARLEALGVKTWPIWAKEPQNFPGLTTARRPVTSWQEKSLSPRLAAPRCPWGKVTW